VFAKYGETKEGYWTCDRFIQQMKKAIKIAEFKYPKDGDMFGYLITAVVMLMIP